jgi:phosphatidylglycerol lysyltransferase
MLVQPVLVRAPATSAERERARRIVAAHGRTSLAGFTLLDDKSYLFSADWLVAYVPRRGVALALGDPIGPPAQAEEAIRRFCDVASRNGWLPAFYQTLPDFLPLYAHSGLEAVCIGHEAIVEVNPFRLKGNVNKPLRTQINRMQRLQHTAQVNTPPIADALLAELHEISDAWLSARQSSEMGFAVGRFDDDYVRESLVTTVRDPRGRVTAFVSAAPEYQEPELAIDLMRRRLDAEPGTMEMLLVTLIQWAREQGTPRVNLGLSGLAGIGQTPSDPALEKALHFIYDHLNQLYNFKGLHAFKEKFHPVWSPRYLIYPGTTALPAVLPALVRAETGGGVLFRAAQRLASPVPPSRPDGMRPDGLISTAHASQSSKARW